MLEIDLERIAAAVERIGGPGALEDRWAARFRDGTPSRDTFHRWRTSSPFPGPLRSYLRFCGCLDLDPVSLVPVGKLGGPGFGDWLLKRMMRPLPGRGVGPNDIMDLLGPRNPWPSPSHLQDAFGRDWYRAFFNNPGGATTLYKRLCLSGEVGNVQQTYHVAWREGRDEFWRMYGSLILDGTLCMLIYYYGRNQKLPCEKPSQVRFLTRFGVEASEFCVCSIHPFKLCDDGFQEPNDDVLWFP
jgi:hypothetical protein